VRKLKVLVIGAGTGGLCLAHGLRAAGIDVRVFERDRTPTDRVQGYRLTINATGAGALRSCLPTASFQRYVDASAKISTGVTFLDHKLRRLLAIDLPQTDQAAPEAPRPISRLALRQILLGGLEDEVSFGETFTDFEVSDDRVVARFESGLRAEGDLLIGADGASSRVRRQLLPHAERIDTGLVTVSAKVALDAAVRSETPPCVFKGPTLILGPRGGFMFAGAVEYPTDHGPSDYDRSEYVMWGFSMHRDTLRIGAVEEVSADTAKKAVLAQLSEWSPAVQRLVERAEGASLTCFAVKSSVPIAPWTTRRVTLLGDALHNMTPYRGIGANTALRDAASLRDGLREVEGGRRDLLPALAAYERGMIEYGFAAVRASLAQMKRLHTRSTLKRLMTQAFFRVIDSSPTLQRRMLASGTD
jgi:2-polyprenyl-6-methoxyphenol hydroxylase-like FAD-dependent oxidoreductase